MRRQRSELEPLVVFTRELKLCPRKTTYRLGAVRELLVTSTCFSDAGCGPAEKKRSKDVNEG
jgi:hypothetical protein